MKLTFKISMILYISLLISCNSNQYVSSQQYIPLNEKKGEIKSNIYINTFQIGYSITNHLSLYGEYLKRNYQFITVFDGFENFGQIGGNNKILDKNLGLSYFNILKKYKFEILFGIGKGTYGYYYYIHNPDSNYSGKTDYNFGVDSKKFNLYLQPNFGYKFKEKLFIGEIGLFSRIYYTRLYDINTSFENNSPTPSKQIHLIFLNKDNMNFYFLEPGIFLKAGIKYMSFQFIFSPQNICLNNKYLKIQKMNIFFSINLNINLFKQ